MNLNPLLLDQLLQLFIVVSFLAEFNPSARISHVLVKLESKLDMNSDGPEVVDHDLLDVDVLESVGVVDELSFVVESILIFFEGKSSSSV